MKRCVIFILRAYQKIISPFMGQICRYSPSCSDYAIEAVRYYGICVGLWKSFKRILRCNPWSSGGYDPIS